MADKQPTGLIDATAVCPAEQTTTQPTGPADAVVGQTTDQTTGQTAEQTKEQTTEQTTEPPGAGDAFTCDGIVIPRLVAQSRYRTSYFKNSKGCEFFTAQCVLCGNTATMGSLGDAFDELARVDACERRSVCPPECVCPEH